MRAWALVASVMVVGCDTPASRPLAPGDPGSIVSRSIPMDPPATQADEDLVLRVAIAVDGTTTLDGELVALEALGARVTARMVGQTPEHTRALFERRARHDARTGRRRPGRRPRGRRDALRDRHPAVEPCARNRRAGRRAAERAATDGA